MEYLKTVLIVDDEQDVRENVQYKLSRLRVSFIHASNGQEALQFLKEYPIDLVICDINMPKMNGREFVKLARHSGYDAPFIIFTGSPVSYIMDELKKYGVDDFLDKLSSERILETVHRALESESTHQLRLTFENSINKIHRKIDYLTEET
jgi:two-component system response regulator YesN